MAKTPNLKDAYAPQSPEGIKQLYESWAESYDSGFGEAEGYQLPREVALAFIAANGIGPVLDVGAGTGLVAERLASAGVGPIDGLDLSPDMLAVAAMKGCYRELYAADVTRPLNALSDAAYSGIVSAGTFTLGHVGPAGIDSLMAVAATHCLFCISVNAKHYVRSGIEKKIALLDTDILDLKSHEVRIYDDRAAPEHRDDLALILTFRKA